MDDMSKSKGDVFPISPGSTDGLLKKGYISVCEARKILCTISSGQSKRSIGIKERLRNNIIKLANKIFS